MNNLTATEIQIQWHSALPIYASESFLRAVGDQYGWIGGEDSTGSLRCFLPYTIIRKAGFSLVRFRTAVIPLAGDLGLDEEKSFLTSVVEHFRLMGAGMIVPATNAALFQTYPEGAAAAPYGTFIKDLEKPEADLFNEIHADYRKKIRSAIKAGVEIKSGEQYLEAAYSIVSNTLKRSGADVIKNSEDFKKSVLSLGESVKIFVAEYQGVLHACLISPFSKYSAYTFYGGTIPEPQKGAMHLVHWEAMRQFREMGVRQFNFQGVRVNPEQGSKQEGILTFKQRFGGRLVQGYMWKYSLCPLQSTIYSVAVRLLKGGDIVDQEHHKLS